MCEKRVTIPYFLWPAISGIMISLGIMYLPSWICWIGLCPLFIVILKKRSSFFVSGFVYGSFLGSILLFWITSRLPDYTGWSLFASFGLYAIMILLTGLWFGLLVRLVGFLESFSFPYILKGLLIAMLWSFSELLLSGLTPGIPWLNYYLGNIVLRDLYLIQVASLGGLHFLSFFIVLVNYLIAKIFVGLSRGELNYIRQIVLPLGIVLLLFLSGYFLYRPYESDQHKQDRSDLISFTLLNEHLAPSVKWTEVTGNVLSERYFSLNRKLSSVRSDFVVWTESSIPWTYNEEDDFLNRIFEINHHSPSIHIIGINTDVGEGTVYNSAYFLTAAEGRIGRYDKQHLLYCLEKPLHFFFLPLAHLSEDLHMEEGLYSGPVTTSFGNIGVQICNESILSKTARRLVHAGAGMLVHISNDGWVANNYLKDLHFYHSRVRAVETRKDVVVNSNMGISGKISASGRIDTQHEFSDPGLITVYASFNQDQSFYASYPYFWIMTLLSSAILSTLIFIIHQKIKKQ